MTYQTLTVLFPGQGSQYIGMGQRLPAYFLRASSILDYPLHKICFEGPEAELKKTANTQPAILAHSMALYSHLKEILPKNSPPIAYHLGHSVGEYAALVASSALSFEQGVQLTAKRGEFMQLAVPPGEGTMMAFLRVPAETVIQACEELKKEVWPANFNSPDQTVVSGRPQDCQALAQLLKSKGLPRFRAVELQVSAPFHCPLMGPAAEKMKTLLDQTVLERLKVPYIANCNAELYSPEKTSPSQIKQNLIDQIPSPVLWNQSLQAIPQDSLCLEVGPGTVLRNLMKKCRPDLKVISMDSPTAEEEIAAELN